MHCHFSSHLELELSEDKLVLWSLFRLVVGKMSFFYQHTVSYHPEFRFMIMPFPLASVIVAERKTPGMLMLSLNHI